MKVIGSYEKARVYIDRHSSEDEKLIKRKQNPGPVITVSRETGIGAVAICERLTEYFNQRAIEHYNDWTYFDRSLMEKVMEDHHIPEYFRIFFDEEYSTKIDSWFSEMIGIVPSKLSMVKKTTQTILKLAEFGNSILVGRGSTIITSKFPNAFHVRLVAPLNHRIDTAMELYNFDRKTTTEFIKHEDEARRNYVAKYFHKNIEDPLLYHLVVNTYRLSFDEIAEMLGHCVIKRFPRFFLPPFRITLYQ
jgi:cytidylate kinase